MDFVFPLDLTAEPESYLDAAITSLFYWNNIMHDLFYVYGFDESAGNFQNTNIGKTGKGGDNVIANAQDGSGYSNSLSYYLIDLKIMQTLLLLLMVKMVE